MAQEVPQERPQEVSLELKIKVYPDPENSLRYKTDMTIDGHTISLGGYLDRNRIIGYIDIALQQAWAYLGFLERAKTEESRKMNYDMLLLHLQFALADALAYQIAKDINEEDICKEMENHIEYMCEVNECAGLVKEDEEACIESCKKAVCGSKD